MSEQTILVDPELARQALGDVLDADAAAQPAAAPPPRRPPIEGATPEAPYGFKADGTPRKSPPGPGRPRLNRDPDNKARTQDEPASPSSSSPGGSSSGTVATVDSQRSYQEELGSAFTVVWMGLSSIPFTQAHAGVLNRHMAEMIPAWDKAAQQNATVRKYVLKLSGDGSWGWVIPVMATTTPLVLSMWNVSVNKEMRAELREENRLNFRAFILDQARAAGLEIPEELEGQAQRPASQIPDPPEDPASGQSDDGSTPPSSATSSPDPSAFLMEV